MTMRKQINIMQLNYLKLNNYLTNLGENKHQKSNYRFVFFFFFLFFVFFVVFFYEDLFL